MEAVKLADVVKFSEEELRYLTSTESLESALASFDQPLGSLSSSH
ncbi:hypothetical protein JCM19233_550 [Vibrio astriarenae]|nr:hypothetical protein JCM19233_550 [Vibrio sp. C7]